MRPLASSRPGPSASCSSTPTSVSLVDGVRCRGHVIYPNKLIVVDRRLPVEEQAEVFADALLDCLRRR